MIRITKSGRSIQAMVMTESIDRCRGVVQCALAGCEAWTPLVEETNDGDMRGQLEWFLENHACRASSVTVRPRASFVDRRVRWIGTGDPPVLDRVCRHEALDADEQRIWCNCCDSVERRTYFERIYVREGSP